MSSHGADGFLTEARMACGFPVGYARVRSEEHGPNRVAHATRLPPEAFAWPVPWSPRFVSPLHFSYWGVSVGWNGEGLPSGFDHPWAVEVGRTLGQSATDEFVDPFGPLNGPLDYEYLACFCIDEYEGEDKSLGQRALFHMLDALIAINEDYLRAHPDFPSLYDYPVFYNPDKLRLPIGVQYEEWKSIPSIVKRYRERLAQGNPDGKVVDCKDLVCWFCAEWRVRHGIYALPTIQSITLPNGRQVYHIQAMLPDGTIVDVSRDKGMV